MKIIEDYLKKDLKRTDLVSWSEIRAEYALRATQLVKNDWQSPAYLSSLDNQAGRRRGQIIGNINDYTRDKHDLALAYEKKFAKAYLPLIGMFRPEPFVTASGMAALTTIITMLHRNYGVNQTVLVGQHSYFQNLELLTSSFFRVVLFDEMKVDVWEKLIVSESPIAVFVDTLCNVSDLTVPPVMAMADYLRKAVAKKTYLIVDNSMLSIGFPWKELLQFRSRKLDIVGWESLNKYYQFGLDRVTGGVVWGTGKLSLELFNARMHAGTIMPDIQAATLPTPNNKLMRHYLARIEYNRRLLHGYLGERGREAETGYGFNGAQVVVRFEKKKSYGAIQRIIGAMIRRARMDGIQLSAGTSFGFVTTRVYLTARQTKYAEMFLRISVGVEEQETMKKIAEIISSSLN